MYQTHARHSARVVAVGVGILIAACTWILSSMEASPTAKMAPAILQETGLYSDFSSLLIYPEHLEFSPQYPLWSDGAVKRRWFSLPAGSRIDASDPDAWIFPIGTRFWKEFSFGGQRVETRYLERGPNGEWIYAAYQWSADGLEARLASSRGKRAAYGLANARFHAIPSVSDCKACHQGGRSEVLGFSGLQLSPQRDPEALHAEASSDPAVDLNLLTERGLIVGLPDTTRWQSLNLAARTETERAVLGYMHGNCGHCHNERGSLKNLGLFLAHSLTSSGRPHGITTTVDRPVKKAAPGQSADSVFRIEPQHPDRSAVMQRVASRYPALQMPPLGTELVDEAFVNLLRDWINEIGQRQEPLLTGGQMHEEKQ